MLTHLFITRLLTASKGRFTLIISSSFAPAYLHYRYTAAFLGNLHQSGSFWPLIVLVIAGGDGQGCLLKIQYPFRLVRTERLASTWLTRCCFRWLHAHVIAHSRIIRVLAVLLLSDERNADIA